MSHNNATRIFNNLVILSTIYDHLNRTDLLCMLCTSRSVFDVTARRIWKALDSIEPLLMLLAPTIIWHEEEENVANVMLPAFGPQTFARFEIYNAFVQKLIISNKWSLGKQSLTTVQLRSWSTLSYRVRRAPLLPNLHDLTIRGKFFDGEEVVIWLSTFASSSLKTLDFCSSSLGTVLTHHHTATILGLLTQKCPQLQKLVHRLRIIPYDHKHEFIEQSTVSQFVLSPLACGHLHNSRHLTFLSIKGQFINSEIFLALSCLPKLQIFSIEQVLNRNVNLPGIFNDAQLPEGSFPALQELQLLFRELDDFQAAWNAAPLVSGLATIYLGYIAAADATSSIYEDGILHSLLQRISASSSHANKLTLSSSFFREPPPIDLENSPWAHVRHLPLTHLKLRGFRVDAASLKNAQQVWPSLLVLEMPFQLLTLEHLARLSWLPQLRELHAAGFEYVIGEIPRMQCHAGAPLHMIKLTGLLSGRVEIRFVEDVARFLLRLWPELQRIEYKNKSDDILQPDLKLLNMHICITRGVAETKRRISTRYGPGAVKSLLDGQLSSF